MQNPSRTISGSKTYDVYNSLGRGAGFDHLSRDRLTVTGPRWQRRHPPVRVEVRSAGHDSIYSEDRVVVSGERFVAERFGGRNLQQFSAEGCEFVDCKFDDLDVESASFGAGRVTSTYLGCTFRDSKLLMAAGGYARFENCAFEKTLISNWFCFAVDIVGCLFSGTISGSIFNGSVPLERRGDAKRSSNEIVDNDFSGATFVGVGFRTGVDLTRQQLPKQPGLIYLGDATAAVVGARSELESLTGVDKKVLLGASRILGGLESEVQAGQNQLLLAIADFPTRYRDVMSKLFAGASS